MLRNFLSNHKNLPLKKDLMQVTDATLKVTRIQVQKNNHAGLGCICPVLLLHWEK